MGVFFRKSINLGAFRLNFSESGIGVSTGTRGFRYSFGPRGAFINIGRNGVYYRQRIFRQSRNHSHSNYENAANGPDPIPTADVSELVNSNSYEILDQINQNIRKFSIGPIIRWSVVIGACLTAQLPLDIRWWMGFAILFPGLIIAALVDAEDKKQRTTSLLYELRDDAEADYSRIQNACSALASSDRIWHIEGMQEAPDRKYNAGASSLIGRSVAVVNANSSPPLIATNVATPCIRTKTLNLYFFPDQILVLQGNRYGSVSYESLQVDYVSQQYIESESIPRDAQRVGTTWQYVNKDGGPDRRFTKNNPQFPVLLYGYILLSSNSGLNVHLQVSSSLHAQEFCAAFGTSNRHEQQSSKKRSSQNDGSARNQQHNGQQRNKQAESETKRDQSQKDGSSLEPPSPYAVLGISPGASAAEIAAAYHRMAKMYHPDKVAGLAPEFGQLADIRMKEINGAYEALTKAT